MLATSGSSAGATPAPWFRRRPALTILVASALYVAVFALRMLAGGPVDAYSMLYALPVALLAVAFGLRAGVAAGVLGVVLIAVWAVTKDISLGVTGWASRVVPMLLLGVLLGEATDRLRRTEEARSQLEAAALLHRKAIEINDSLVQGMAAAKWSLEAGNLDVGLRMLDDTLVRAQDLVSGLIRQADMGTRTEPVQNGDRR
jgi:K+-sensing histidine kinase KdpD